MKRSQIFSDLIETGSSVDKDGKLLCLMRSSLISFVNNIMYPSAHTIFDDAEGFRIHGGDFGIVTRDKKKIYNGREESTIREETIASKPSETPVSEEPAALALSKPVNATTATRDHWASRCTILPSNNDRISANTLDVVSFHRYRPGASCLICDWRR